MKNKIFKILTVLLVILSMTITKFIFIGESLYASYASDLSTNHENIEFEAYFKTKEGTETTNLKSKLNEDKLFLYLNINIKKEGYFNGIVRLGNSNFEFKQSNSEYVNKIENDVIHLAQINVGEVKEIEIEIEPIKNDNFKIGLLNMESIITLEGIYRDRTERDINVEATKALKLELEEDNTEESVISEIEVITNKIVEINGQEKRILELSYNMGLKENNYPIKEIYAEIKIDNKDGKTAEEVNGVGYLNNMRTFRYNYNKECIEITLKNEADSNGEIIWKKDGIENVILTCILEKDVDIENTKIIANQKITLYNNKKLITENVVDIPTEELDSIIQISNKNSEESIYKGKLYSGIEKAYLSSTELKVNYAKIVNNIEITEENSRYNINNRQLTSNIKFNLTAIRKDQFDKLFGENGSITIYNQNNEVIGMVTNETQANEDGNIIIKYSGQDVTQITIKTTNPITEGSIEFRNIKTIYKDNYDFKNATELINTITTKYNESNMQQKNNYIKLMDTITEATVEIDKEELSTIVSNNVEIKVDLLSNNEKYDLYKNPKITVELPEQVEKVTINDINLLYEEELKIASYEVVGRTINVFLEGEQSRYKDPAIDGALIIINATVNVNKKSVTKSSNIKMSYTNDKEVVYASGETGIEEKEIKIVAPQDVTTVYSIDELQVETLGEEATEPIQVKMEEQEKDYKAQMEIINNSEENIENIRVIGNLPTNNNSNNMNIQISSKIDFAGLENAKVYYTENANATEDLDNKANNWSEEIADASKVNKFLLVVDNIPSSSSIVGSYTYKLPSNLSYNQTARTNYTVKEVNSLTKVESEFKSTVIAMETEKGPDAEIKLTATRRGEKINDTVKSGEVIKYSIEVTNTGTEDLTNVVVNANVPDGTKLVVERDDYEYTSEDYYQEIDTRTYTETIENLKVGETIVKEYEVRVSKETESQKNLTNKAQIQYNGVTKESNEVVNTTEKGELKVSIKCYTERDTKLYPGSVLEYMAYIENISDENQENVKISFKTSDNIEIDSIYLLDSEKIGDEGYSGDEIEYADSINIGTIKANNYKVMKMAYIIKEGNEQTKYSAIVESADKKYESNNWTSVVNDINIDLFMSTNLTSKNVKAGDTIEYTITCTNNNNEDFDIAYLKDTIPEQLTVKKVTVDGAETENYNENNELSNEIIEILQIKAKETKVIKIETIVNYSTNRNTDENIENQASLEISGNVVATTEKIQNIIEANKDEEENQGGNEGGNQGENQGGNEGGNQGGNQGEDENNDVANGTKTISGMAWYDENGNGIKEDKETSASGITVKLLNTKTNNLITNEDGQVLEVNTNEEGLYRLEKIANGEYIAIFDFNNRQYKLTKYRVQGVGEEKNSNVLMNELLINEENQEVASTDILKINNNNIENINIGLIKLQNFDLKLDKYISKITVSNSSRNHSARV